jgi:ribosomal-protein-serine acetyltransferase
VAIVEKLNPKKVLKVSDKTDIYLRLTSLDDALTLYDIVHENREHLKPYQRWARNATPESIEAAIQEAIENTAKGTWLQYRIMLRHEAASDKIIGTLTFYDHDEASRIVKLGYWLTKEYEGRGYVSTAVKSLLQYGFEHWNLNKVLLEIAPGNERSVKVAQRLGAKSTARFTEEKIDGQVYKRRVWEVLKP